MWYPDACIWRFCPIYTEAYKYVGLVRTNGIINFSVAPRAAHTSKKIPCNSQQLAHVRYVFCEIPCRLNGPFGACRIWDLGRVLLQSLYPPMCLSLVQKPFTVVMSGEKSIFGSTGNIDLVSIGFWVVNDVGGLCRLLLGNFIKFSAIWLGFMCINTKCDCRKP